jgi:hypothetical protein
MPTDISSLSNHIRLNAQDTVLLEYFPYFEK